MLKWSALAAAATVVPARASLGASWSGRTLGLSWPRATIGKPSSSALVPVQVQPERIIRIVAGLRPFRPSGFVVRAERLSGKTIIHNYGHGGCGLTLSWGTGNLAVAEGLKTPFRDAAVLGCGAVGLATARLLQDHGLRVTIYAKALPPDTTSNIAGGYWSPVTLFDDDRRTPAFDAQLDSAAQFAYRYYQTLVSERYGVHWTPMYYLGNTPPGRAPSEATDTARMSPIALVSKEQNPFAAPVVYYRESILIEPSIYLPALISDFCVRGGKIVVQNLQNRAAVLRLPQRLIFNCTGLGAKALFDDQELAPIKGQLTVLVPQPEVDYGVLSRTDDLYMFPRRDGILLGGSHQRGEWSLDPDKAESERIFAGHREIFSNMK